MQDITQEYPLRHLASTIFRTTTTKKKTLFTTTTTLLLYFNNGLKLSAGATCTDE